MTSFTLSLGHPRAANFTGYSAVSQPRQRQRSSLLFLHFRGNRIGAMTNRPRRTTKRSPIDSSRLRPSHRCAPNGPDFSHIPESPIATLGTIFPPLSLPFLTFLFFLIPAQPHTRIATQGPRLSHPYGESRPLYPLARVCVRVHLYLARDAD